MTTGNLHSLTAQSVLEALNTALDRASRGELRSVAIAYEATDDRTGHIIGIGKKAWTTALLGELEATKLSILVEDGRLHPKGSVP